MAALEQGGCNMLNLPGSHEVSDATVFAGTRAAPIRADIRQAL
jgi:hypothetical protein